MIKTNIKSSSGFTMTDLIVALIIFLIFSGLVVTAFYSSYVVNSKTKVTASATNYSIQILEDIDKITYDEVQNGMENTYRQKFSIPDGYSLKMEVTNYNEGNDKEDLLKNVKLIIEYKIAGDTEKIVINKIKVKELENMKGEI